MNNCWMTRWQTSEFHVWVTEKKKTKLCADLNPWHGLATLTSNVLPVLSNSGGTKEPSGSSEAEKIPITCIINYVWEARSKSQCHLKVTPHIIRHSTHGTSVLRHPNEMWSGIPIPHAKTTAGHGAAMVVCLCLRNVQTTEIITDKHVWRYLQILGWSGAKIGHCWDGPEWGHADLGETSGQTRAPSDGLGTKKKWRECCGRRKEKRDEEEDSKMGRIWSCRHSWGIFCHMLGSSHASPHHPLHPTRLISCMSFSFLLIHLLLPVYVSRFLFNFIFLPSLSTPHHDICFYHFVFHWLLFLLYCPSLTSFISLLLSFSFLGWISPQIDWQPDGDTRKRELGMTSSKGSSLTRLLAAARTLLSLILFFSPCTHLFSELLTKSPTSPPFLPPFYFLSAIYFLFSVLSCPLLSTFSPFYNLLFSVFFVSQTGQ